jgi:hypothetical protein
LTIQCFLTKFVIAIALEDQTSESICKALVKNLILKYGLFSEMSIITDNAQNFTSKIFKGMCALLGVRKLRTTIYHAQANAVERFHSVLNQMLRSFSTNDLNKWDEVLPSVSSATTVLRTSPLNLVRLCYCLATNQKFRQILKKSQNLYTIMMTTCLI